MKKSYILIITILSLNFVSCQEKQFPDLEEKKVMKYSDNPEYFEQQYNNEETNEYFSFYKSVYEYTTTKDPTLKTKKDNNKTSFPWNNKITIEIANKILENINDSIYVTKDGYASHSNSPTKGIMILSPNVLKFTNQEFQEFESTGSLKRSHNVLDNINYNYIDYNLKNENGNNVKIEQEYLGVCGQGIYKTGNSYYHGFCMFNNSLKPEYIKLSGSINIEVQVPIDYLIKKVTKKDVGGIFNIGKNKIKILEFDANAFHYQILEKDVEFETIYNVNNSSELILPFNFYTKLRQNQGLNFDKVVERKDFFELEKKRGNYKEEVFIIKFDDYSLDNVYFYIPKYVSKKIKIPVNIN